LKRPDSKVVFAFSHLRKKSMKKISYDEAAHDAWDI
jgi:hypothetical protein